MSWEAFERFAKVVQFVGACGGLSVLLLGVARHFEFESVPTWVALVCVFVLTVFGFIAGWRSKPVPIDEPGTPVRLGDTIKLIHRQTRKALHSHSAVYRHDGTSGQQQVTCYDGADPNDYWLVKPPHGSNDFDNRGAVLHHDSIIRLEHRNTRKNLHSHPGFRSPLTGQQEVTAYGYDGVGDTKDDWRIVLQGDRTWRALQEIRLIHVETKAALHSSPGCAHDQYTAGQQEVSGYSERDENDVWVAIIVTRPSA